MITIENKENSLLVSVILDELSNAFSTVIPENNIKITTTIVDNTKGEINLFLQLITDLSISIVASMAYDFIKMIVKSKSQSIKNCIDKDNLELVIGSNDNINIINISYKRSIDKIDITMK